MVILYTQPQCPACETVKRALNMRKISYETKDISTDQVAYDHIVELGYRSVPVVDTGEINWSGYRPDLIAKLTTN